MKKWKKANPDRVKAWTNTEKRKRWQKNRDLVRAFGITLDDYERMCVVQASLCAICRKPETWQRNGVTVSLSVDHDHVTKKVRELLCYQCNTALGKVRESEEVLLSMLAYIRRHK